MAAATSPERPSGAAIGRATLLTAALLALSGAAEGATGPSGTCRAVPAGSAVAVHAQLDDLFPGELLRLVALGLSGRLKVEVDLVRKRALWFSHRVARQELELTVSRAASGDGFLLDGDRLLPDLTHLRLPRLLLPAGGETDQLEVQIRVQLRVITPGSLGKMATWVAGGDSKQEERSALSAGLLSLLADELARSVEMTCGVAKRAVPAERR